MKIAFTLGGTDEGRSGLGSYVRAVLPEFIATAEAAGDQLLVLGTQTELDIYAEAWRGAAPIVAPGWSSAPGPSALWYAAAAGRAARRAGADVVLYSAANRRCGYLGSLPSVAVVHDLAQLHVPEKYDALRMAYFKRLLGALQRVTRVVAISELTRDDVLATLAVGRDQVDVVPNGVDATRFSPRPHSDPEVQRARADVGVEGPYLLYASRLEHPGKNHLRLIEAFARSRCRRTHRLVLVGGDWGAGARIQGALRGEGLEDRVVMAGYVSDALLPPLICGAAGVVMVGLREGFGLPALEALAAGRPVCASNSGALPEVAGDLAAYCDPYSVSSISAALDRLIEDEGLRTRSRIEGPLRAASRGWDTTARGLHKACRQAAGARLLHAEAPHSTAPTSHGPGSGGPHSRAPKNRRAARGQSGREAAE